MTAPHAAARALERYGIELTLDDLQAIARRCQKGEGLVGHAARGARNHLIVFGERVLHVVYQPADGRTRHEYGEVATILPSASAAEKLAARSAAHRINRKGGFARFKRRG